MQKNDKVCATQPPIDIQKFRFDIALRTQVSNCICRRLSDHPS